MSARPPRHRLAQKLTAAAVAYQAAAISRRCAT